MVKGTVDIVDPQFDEYYSIEYTLSILVGMDSFFYFIEDQEANALVLKQIDYSYKSKPTAQQKELELQRILMTEEMLQLPFAQVYICYSTTNFTLIPDELFNKHRLEEYLRQVTRVNDSQSIDSYPLGKLNLQVVYSVDNVVKDVVKSYFPGSKHLHIIAPLIMQAYHECQHKEGKYVFVHVGNGIMGVVLFNGTQLELVNTFPFQSDLDFMYHTLLIYDEFKLDQREVPILISGRAHKRTSTYDQLSKYIGKISFIHPPSHYQYSNIFEDVDFHFYRDLLSIKLCV